MDFETTQASGNRRVDALPSSGAGRLTVTELPLGHRDGHLPGAGTPVVAAPGVRDAAAATRHRQPRRGRRRLLAVFATVTVVVAAVGLGVWRPWSDSSFPEARLSVTQPAGGPVVTATSGVLSFDQLRDNLAATGHGDYLRQVAGGAYELTVDLVVGNGASVNLARTALLLGSDARRHVRISVEGGRLTFDHDTIASWTDDGTVDADVSDGRADIVAQGVGSRLEFNDCTVSFLGANANDPGVSWRQGASGGANGSTFKSDFRGAYVYKSGAVTIAGSTFASDTEDGLLLLYPGAGTSISSSTFTGNGADGLAISHGNATLVDAVEASGNADVGVNVDSGSGVRIDDVRIHDNKQQGIIFNVADATVTGSKLWSNATGASITGGNVTIDGTFASGNVTDGVFVTGAARVTLTNDRLDHNARSGLWLADGATTVSGSLFDENSAGADVANAAVSFTAHGNTIRSSGKDGIALEGTKNLKVTGNTITGSGAAAFSTATKVDVSSLLKTNTIASGQPKTRVRNP